MEANRELRRRGFNPLCQMHLDWLPGLADAFRASNGKGVISNGIWHMVKNLWCNQRSHSRDGTPALSTNNRLESVIMRCHDTSTLPTKQMYHLHWAVQRERMCARWQESIWTNNYFFKQYFSPYEALLPRHAAEQGVSHLITSTWWYGLESPYTAGHGASQQPPKQGHSNTKRSVPPGATMRKTLENFEKAVTVWSRQPPPGDAEEKEFSLLADPRNISVVPTTPDTWMMGAGLVAKPPGRGAVFLPSIGHICSAYDDTKGTRAATVQRFAMGSRAALVMRTGTPAPTARSYVQALVTQLKTKNIAELDTQWRQMNIIQDLPPHGASAPDVAASPKVVLPELHKAGGRHCVVMVGGAPTICTCFYARRNGHCNHGYGGEEMEGLATHVGAVVGDASAGAQALRDGGHGADALVAALPTESRAAREARVRAARRGCEQLLGAAASGVPECTHAAMCAMAADDMVPLTTLERRESLVRSTPRVTVPEIFQTTAKFFYVHPTLTAPSGYKWKNPSRLTRQLIPK